MAESLFIGVDGGATKCIVRIEDENGKLLGRETSGPANLRISVLKASESIHEALSKILKSLNITENDKHYRLHAGMGLAGCEVNSAYQSFVSLPHLFETLVVSSDAHTACLGAHAGSDGAIIIIGTGVAGFQIQSNQTTKVGGWGFPQDDEGGGAYLGLQAVKSTLQALDGRLPDCDLAKRVYERFENDMDRFVTWTNQANSTAFAELAPIVIQQCQSGDEMAISIMQQAGKAVDSVADALYSAQQDQMKPLPCSLVGGVAPFIEPFLSEKLRARLSPCQLTPDQGAVLLAKKNSGKKSNDS